MNPQQNFGNFAPTQPVNSDDKKTKLMFIGLGALLLISIILVLASMANRDGADSFFIQSIGRHKEQLRIAELAEDFSEDDRDLINYQSTLKALVASDLASLQTAYGKEVNDKQVSTLVDEEVEARFTEASQTNSFNTEYKKTMSTTLNATLSDLENLRAEAKSDKLKVIDTAIANQKSLISQLDKL